MKKFINLLLAIIIALAGHTFLYQPDKTEIKTAFSMPAEAAYQKKDSILKGQLKISVLNVGHGDAILLEGCGKTIMVDVGHSRNQDILLRKLAECGITRIDEIILTHHHQDHIGNILTIAQRYKPKLIYDSGMPNSEGVTSQKLEEAFRTGRYNRQILKADDKITLGDGYWIEVLAPGDYLDKKTYARVNNTSLVFMLHYWDFTMMFTGDTGNPVEAAMAARYGSHC
ncbi:MAG: MBL fold metallo-hydrolase [Phascolarctobacterium sp.]|nr:MBL fold metallo-hydrolase [Phascolarctobacterium sp.]